MMDTIGIWIGAWLMLGMLVACLGKISLFVYDQFQKAIDRKPFVITPALILERAKEMIGVPVIFFCVLFGALLAWPYALWAIFKEEMQQRGLIK